MSVGPLPQLVARILGLVKSDACKNVECESAVRLLQKKYFHVHRSVWFCTGSQVSSHACKSLRVKVRLHSVKIADGLGMLSNRLFHPNNLSG